MNQKLSYAQSVNGTLPHGWTWSTLGEVSEVSAGNPAPQGAEFFVGGKYPFVRVQDMGRLNSAVKIVATNDYINEKAAARLRLFPKGSVLFTKSGASTLLNQRGILGRDMYIVSHIAVAIPKEGIISEWLYYWLRTVDFAKLAHATTLPSLPLSKARAIPVPVAPFVEQESIAAEIEKQFSRLDEAVKSLKRIKTNLKRYKAAVLKAAAEGQLVETEASIAQREKRSYETGEQLLKRILETRRSQWKDKGKYKEPVAPDTSNLSSLPMGWTWATLEQLCPVFVDSAHRTPKYESSGFAAVGPRDVVGGELRLSAARMVSRGEFDIQTKRRIPQAGDVIYSRELSLGWAAVVPADSQICLSQGMCLFRPSEQISQSYFVQSLNGPATREQATRGSTGSAHPHLNLGEIKAFKIPLPPLAEQQRIAIEIDRRLSIVAEVEAQIEINSSRAQRLRQAVLSRAFHPISQ